MVLFVDDEPMILVTLKVILENEGFCVVAVSNVADAIAEIGKHRFDILLSDLNIGEPGDGFTVVSAMKRIQPHVKTIIITGFPDFQSALGCIQGQVDDYMIKPTSVQSLIKLVRTHLKEPCLSPKFHHQRISDVVENEKDKILELWLQMVKGNRYWASIDISDEDLLSRAELALDKLILRLRLKKDGYIDEASAIERGRARRQQGYSLPMLIEETRLIQFSVFTVLQDDLLLLDASLIIPDMITIADFFQERLRIATEAFLDVSNNATPSL